MLFYLPGFSISCCFLLLLSSLPVLSFLSASFFCFFSFVSFSLPSHFLFPFFLSILCPVVVSFRSLSLFLVLYCCFLRSRISSFALSLFFLSHSLLSITYFSFSISLPLSFLSYTCFFITIFTLFPFIYLPSSSLSFPIFPFLFSSFFTFSCLLLFFLPLFLSIVSYSFPSSVFALFPVLYLQLSSYFLLFSPLFILFFPFFLFNFLLFTCSCLFSVSCLGFFFFTSVYLPPQFLFFFLPIYLYLFHLASSFATACRYISCLFSTDYSFFVSLSTIFISLSFPFSFLLALSLVSFLF